MRTGLFLVIGVALVCASGCADKPMPTDGPNQVVIKVPTMT